MYKTELFYFPECPFCQMVVNGLQTLNLNIPMRNIREVKDALDKLISDTGRQTVPCLYIDGKPMHESQEILEWLKNNSKKIQTS